MSVGIKICLSVLLFAILSGYPIKETDIQTIHPSVARPYVHPYIFHPYPYTAISPRRHFKHVQCPLRWWGSGHLTLADARNGIEVKLNKWPWLSWNHMFASILKCVPMDKHVGLQPHYFVSFLTFYKTPAIGRMPGHIDFGLCVLEDSRTYGRT